MNARALRGSDRNPALASALYVGWLRHRRVAPRPHSFRRRLFMLYLDLAELDVVFRGRWLWSTRGPNLAWLRRADYLAPADLPLDRAVRERVMSATGRIPAGPIRMLTHLRFFGYCFNPVTFYYCFDESGAVPQFILAEITNTPWNERHCYVLTASGARGRCQGRFRQTFHVSPFMAPDLDYDWHFSAPGRRLGVHMRNLKDGAPVFDATLDLQRRELAASSLAGALLRFPLMSGQVIASIYWQALRLRMKGIPVYPHPQASDARRPVAERVP